VKQGEKGWVGMNKSALWVVTGCALCILAGAATAEPQVPSVYELDRVMLDNTSYKDNFTCFDRPYHATHFKWGGKDFIFINAGNDLLIFDPSSTSKTPVVNANLGVGYDCHGWLQGVITASADMEGSSNQSINWLGGSNTGGAGIQLDANAQILGFDNLEHSAICDECRYALAHTPFGTILVDIGEPTKGGTPKLLNRWLLREEKSSRYDGHDFYAIYKHADRHYVVGSLAFGEQCYSGVTASAKGVWEITVGSNGPELRTHSCFPESIGLGQSFTIGAPEDPEGSNFILVTGSGGSDVRVIQLISGEPVLLSWKGTANTINWMPIDWDFSEFPGKPGYLLTTDVKNSATNGELWKVSYSSRQLNFTKMQNFAFPAGETWAVGALTVNENRGEGYLFAATSGYVPNATRAFAKLAGLNGTTVAMDVLEPESTSFWSSPESDLNTILTNDGKASSAGAEFSTNGDALYLARQTALIRLKYAGEPEPTPGVTVLNTDPIYPGSLVSLQNTSVSQGDLDAWGWVTEGLDPDGPKVPPFDSLPDDSMKLLANQKWSWQTQPAFDCTGQPFYSHVRLGDINTGESDRAVVDVICDPDVTILGAPLNALTNSTVTLSPNAPGWQLNHQDYDYEWTYEYTDPHNVLPPLSGTVEPDPGNESFETFALTPGGDWTFKLKVTYDHWNEADQTPYWDDDEKTIGVSGLAPDIDFTPDNPTLDTGITLVPAGTKAALGLENATYEYLVDGTVVCSGPIYNGYGAVAIPDCALENEEPFDYLVPDTTQTAKLRLSADGEPTKEAPISFMVRSHDFDFEFTSANGSPYEKGEEIQFTLTTGNASDLLRWDFGTQGRNCDNETYVDCRFTNCSRVYWSFSAAGTHTVRLLDYLGAQVAQRSIVINNTGSCPVAACDYYTLGFEKRTVYSSGSSFSVPVYGNPTGCTAAWLVTVDTKDKSWIQYSNKTQSSVTVTVLPYNVEGGTRTGHLTIANRRFEVVQLGPTGGGTSGFDFSINYDGSTLEKGEAVTIAVTKGSVNDVERFEFSGTGGGQSCDGDYSWPCALGMCYPSFEWSFATSGTKSIRLVPKTGTAVTKSVTVSNSGQCGDPPPPPEPDCEYDITLTPADGVFPGDGDTGKIVVEASEQDCSWQIRTHWMFSDWIKIKAPAGHVGDGEVEFDILANESDEGRIGSLTFAGEDHEEEFRITQEATPKPMKFSVASVARTKGALGSDWSTQLRVLNPEDDYLPVLVRFVWIGPGPQYARFSMETNYSLPPRITAFVPDIVSWVESQAGIDLQGENVKGSLQIEVQEGGEGRPIITSRTATKAPEGSYGQFIPAIPVAHNDVESLVLTGLIDNGEYRTNVGVTNMNEENISVDLEAIDPSGNVIGRQTVGVFGLANNQQDVRNLFPELSDFDGFSVRAQTHGADVILYATVMHSLTSDPVFIISRPSVDEKVQIIPNVAHNSGKNNSEWRSDLALYNPNGQDISVRMTYVPDPADNLGPTSIERTESLKAFETKVWHDVVRKFHSYDYEESKGYLLIEVNDSGAEPPVVVGKTYTIDGEKLYGQGLQVFTESDLLNEGDVSWIAGVEESDEFRTNFSLLNLGDEPAFVELRFYDEYGVQREGALTARVPEPGVFEQFSLFAAFPALEPGSMRGSIEMRVNKGSKLLPYVTILDEATNDPIFVPDTKIE
jgi:hypothetical protein